MMKSDNAMIEEHSQIVRNAQIPTGAVDGETVALDLERGECFGIDLTGTIIWEMAFRPVLVAEIIDRLGNIYGVDRERCRADVIPFLEELVGAGLVRVLPG